MARGHFKLQLDHDGIAGVLKSDAVAGAVADYAEQVADRVRAHESIVRHNLGAVVKTETYETDRAAAGVVIAHPAGLPIEAKYGVVSRAVEDVGLEMRSRE